MGVGWGQWKHAAFLVLCAGFATFRADWIRDAVIRGQAAFRMLCAGLVEKVNTAAASRPRPAGARGSDQAAAWAWGPAVWEAGGGWGMAEVGEGA